VQKCVRTGDIDDVGDASHCTFFEMLGNWSLGDYFKKEAIAYSWEFLTSKRWLGIDKDRLYFTCFLGDEDAPRDEESFNCWVEMGVDPSHIYYLPKKYNWWGPAGQTAKCSEECSPACSCGKYLEIWNDVFMEYNKVAEGKYEPLAQKNVDTGMGLDRTVATLQGVESVYDTDAFKETLNTISRLSSTEYLENEEVTRSFRIIADHIRCAVFILGDERGVTPSNVDQGYILRRLIRRAIRYAMQLGIEEGGLIEVAKSVIAQYGGFYEELNKNSGKILLELSKEEQRFGKTLKKGIKEFERLISTLEGLSISGKDAFRLYDTFGFPLEFTEELAKEKGYEVDVPGYNEAFLQHQKKSQLGAEHRFKGGLADNTEETTKLHTATHLLHASLRKVLKDDSVSQKGSNITAERLRFDFSFPRKLTKEELLGVEALVNSIIEEDLPITCEEVSVDEAKESGAIGLFESKYGERVKVYSIGEFSKEICGGPHAASTGVLGSFKITKEEASSAGVRRIKAVLKIS